MGEIGTHEGRFWPCVFEPGQARKKSVLSHNWWMLCRSDFLKMAASLLSISGVSTLEASGRQMDRQCAISFLTPVCLMCLWDFGIWLIAFSRWVHISLRVAMHLSKPYIPAFPVQKKKKKEERMWTWESGKTRFWIVSKWPVPYFPHLKKGKRWAPQGGIDNEPMRIIDTVPETQKAQRKYS